MADGWTSLIDIFEASRTANTRSRPPSSSGLRGWDALMTPPSRPSSGGPGRSGKVDEQWVVDGLMKRGLPQHIAQGFAMNMQDESGLDAGINEITPVVKGSRGGFGLYQLTGPRRREFEAFAGQQGLALDDADAQLDFLMFELGGKESGAARSIMATSTAGEAGAAIVRKFLRPLQSHQDSRAARYMRSGGGSMSSRTAPQQPAFKPGRLWLDLGGM